MTHSFQQLKGRGIRVIIKSNSCLTVPEAIAALLIKNYLVKYHRSSICLCQSGNVANMNLYETAYIFHI